MKWTVDECPDAYGNWTIRLSDGSPNGDILADPIATVYTKRNANNIVNTTNAAAAFLDWFEDNFGEEEWFDTEDDTDGPDGTWKSYLELPEYTRIRDALDEPMPNDNRSEGKEL